jgi:hypothetical protein
MAQLMLRDNGINPENYIGIPDEMGSVKYYREDMFDDLPDQEFNALMMNATPYDSMEMMGDRASRIARRDARRQFKRDKKTDKRQAKQDRITSRQDAKTTRSTTRQGEKTTRGANRGDAFGDIVQGGIASLIDGDQTGATIDFATGQGVQVDGTIGVGSQKNFITDSSIIPGVPNYFILAGAGLGAYFLLKK